MHLIESNETKKKKARLTSLDLKYSRAIFACDFGKIANFIGILHSTLFMEEAFIVTLTALHFLMGQQWEITLKYMIVVLTNVVITVFTKNYWARPRPSLDGECEKSSKTMFFRKK
jgi:hypothetical protein